MAIAAMREHYAGLYGVEELSESLGVSKSHLVRVFKAAVGVPPGQYLTGVRIEAAKQLLCHREYPLEVVASLCGFPGPTICALGIQEGHRPEPHRLAGGRRRGAGASGAAPGTGAVCVSFFLYIVREKPCSHAFNKSHPHFRKDFVFCAKFLHILGYKFPLEGCMIKIRPRFAGRVRPRFASFTEKYKERSVSQ